MGEYAGIITGLTNVSIDTSLWNVTDDQGLGYNFSYDAGTGAVNLSVTAIPEPSISAGLLLGAAGLLIRRRRKVNCI